MADSPPPAEGFVRIRHPKVDGTADVPADNLDHYRSLGWTDADAAPDDDNAEAPAEPEPEAAEEAQP